MIITKNIASLFFLLSVLPLHAQVFSETFDESSGSTSGSDANGTNWTATCPTCQCSSSDYLEVSSGVLEAQDTNGKGIWETEDFNISSCTDGLTISVDISEVGDMEDPSQGGCNTADGIKFEYSYDSGSTWEVYGDATTGTTDSSVYMSDCGTCGDPDCSSSTYPVAWCGDEFSGPLIGTGNFSSSTFSGCASTGSTMRLRVTFVCWAGSEQLQIDNVSVSCSSCALPITLLTFGATYDHSQQHSRLKWQTASEINNDYFTLEKSEDGIVFTPFENIEGAGNSSEILDYLAYDKSPYEGVTYYRLKQTDYDGQYEYSRIVAIETPGSSGLAIHKVKQSDNALKIIYSSENNVVEANLTDLTGRLITEQKAVKGNPLNIDKSALGKGVYLLRLNDSYSQEVKKIFVR